MVPAASDDDVSKTMPELPGIPVIVTILRDNDSSERHEAAHCQNGDEKPDRGEEAECLFYIHEEVTGCKKKIRAVPEFML
jgi:hypothetical protein